MYADVFTITDIILYITYLFTYLLTMMLSLLI